MRAPYKIWLKVPLKSSVQELLAESGGAVHDGDDCSSVKAASHDSQMLVTATKGGFTRRAKAGDNNQQTADDVKRVILRPFTCTRLKGYYSSVNR